VTTLKKEMAMKRGIKARLAACVTIFGLILLGIAGAAHSSAREDGQSALAGVISSAAIERFWDIYHGNDYDAIPEAQARLKEALRFDAKNATLYALLGATYFWHIGEYTRDPKPDMNVLAQDMPTAVRFFQKAVDLDYSSEHLIGYVNDDHLPGYLGITTVHAGQMSNDPASLRRAINCSILRSINFRSSITSIAGPRTTPIKKIALPTKKRSIRSGRL
jgi:hypothetical protein